MRPLVHNPLYRLTLRKEKRRNSWYWFAYLKVDTKLHNAYLGRSEALTEPVLSCPRQHWLAKVRRARATGSEGGVVNESDSP